MADRVVINKMYDVIIVGASKEGLATARYILDNTDKWNICIISPTVKDEKLAAELTADKRVDFFNNKSIYSVYNHGLHYLTLDDKRNVCGLNIVIATGRKPKEQREDKLNIQYSINFSDSNEKDKSALVIGDDEAAAKNTLGLAKRYKQVFLCNEMFNLLCSSKTMDAIKKAENITYLPSTAITSIEYLPKKDVMIASTDTFDTIPCNVVVKKGEYMPDVSGLTDNMVTLEEDGTAVTDENCRTTKVSTIYAIGECAKKTGKKDIVALGNAILASGTFHKKGK